MTTSRRRRALLAAACLAAPCAGCSWLIGVTGDPVVVDDLGADAGDQDREIPMDTAPPIEQDDAEAAAPDAAAD